MIQRCEQLVSGVNTGVATAAPPVGSQHTSIPVERDDCRNASQSTDGQRSPR